MNSTNRTIGATIISAIILASFGIAYSSIIERIDGLEQRVVKVLDDHEMRIRTVERNEALRPQEMRPR